MSHRLLEVYKKLQGVAAASSDDDAQNKLVEQAKILIQEISDEHVFAVNSFLHDASLKEQASQKIQDECQELAEYVVAAKRFNLEVNSRSKDRVASFGEKLSCQFMTYLLNDRVRTPPMSSSGTDNQLTRFRMSKPNTSI
jgi:aspartate kinase